RPIGRGGPAGAGDGGDRGAPGRPSPRRGGPAPAVDPLARRLRPPPVAGRPRRAGGPPTAHASAPGGDRRQRPPAPAPPSGRPVRRPRRKLSLYRPEEGVILTSCWRQRPRALGRFASSPVCSRS